MNITVSEEIKRCCPDFKAGIIRARVKNEEFDSSLWRILENEQNFIKETYVLDNLNKRQAIEGTRRAYKKLGKDPNRYRPSAEALCRRIVKNIDLYRINTLVDLINLISIHSGYSIGGFDADKVAGLNLCLGVGEENEIFHAIGRGKLNIAGLPVYRDNLGPIGTPTSDEERTKLTLETTSLLVIINAYFFSEELENTVDYAVSLLKKYACAEVIEYKIIY